MSAWHRGTSGVPRCQAPVSSRGTKNARAGSRSQSFMKYFFRSVQHGLFMQRQGAVRFGNFLPQNLIHFAKMFKKFFRQGPFMGICLQRDEVAENLRHPQIIKISGFSRIPCDFVRLFVTGVIRPKKKLFRFFFCELQPVFRMGGNVTIFTMFADEFFFYHINTDDASFFFRLFGASHSQRQALFGCNRLNFLGAPLFLPLYDTGKNLPICENCIFFFFIAPKNHL